MNYRPSKRVAARYVYTIRILLALVVVLAIVCGILTWKVIDLKNESEKSDSSSYGDSSISAQSSTPYTGVTSSDSSFLESSGQTSSGDLMSELSSENISSTPVSSGNTSSKSQSSEASSKSSGGSVTALADQLDDWNLRLVNPTHYMSLSDNTSVPLASVKSEFDTKGNSKFDSRAIDKLHAMCSAAKKDGVSLAVVSAYRTNAKQTSLYNNQIEKQRLKYPNLSESELKAKAATISAIPGTSEHELGLAVDLNSVEQSFENTEAFKWLQNHAEEYGFIMRYPKDKQSITGIIYEPWHYRYVGKEHAEKINDLGYCFEEYIKYLENYK